MTVRLLAHNVVYIVHCRFLLFSDNTCPGRPSALRPEWMKIDHKCSERGMVLGRGTAQQLGNLRERCS